MRLPPAAVVAGLILAGLASSPPAASAREPPTPEAVADGFAAAWNRHDTKALAALFSDRADFVNVIGLHWRGRVEIERAHAEIHATRMKESRLTVLGRSARVLRPGVAVVHADWELVGDTGIEGKPLPPRRGVLSFVVVQAEGGWRIESAQNTDVVPIPNAPPARPAVGPT